MRIGEQPYQPIFGFEQPLKVAKKKLGGQNKMAPEGIAPQQKPAGKTKASSIFGEISPFRNKKNKGSPELQEKKQIHTQNKVKLKTANLQLENLEKQKKRVNNRHEKSIGNMRAERNKSLAKVDKATQEFRNFRDDFKLKHKDELVSLRGARKRVDRNYKGREREIMNEVLDNREKILMKPVNDRKGALADLKRREKDRQTGLKIQIDAERRQKVRENKLFNQEITVANARRKQVEAEVILSRMARDVLIKQEKLARAKI